MAKICDRGIFILNIIQICELWSIAAKFTPWLEVNEREIEIVEFSFRK